MAQVLLIGALCVVANILWYAEDVKGLAAFLYVAAAIVGWTPIIASAIISKRKESDEEG